MLNLTWCMHRMKMHVEYRCTILNCAQWILVHNTIIVCVSSRYDEEEMYNRFRCTEKCLPCNIAMHDNINEQVKLMCVNSLRRRGV
jgi:hypothetical protein